MKRRLRLGAAGARLSKEMNEEEGARKNMAPLQRETIRRAYSRSRKCRAREKREKETPALDGERKKSQRLANTRNQSSPTRLRGAIAGRKRRKDLNKKGGGEREDGRRAAKSGKTDRKAKKDSYDLGICLVRSFETGAQEPSARGEERAKTGADKRKATE